MNITKKHRQYCLNMLARYWPRGSELIAQLPCLEVSQITISATPNCYYVELPAWAKEVGVNGKLLVPQDVSKVRTDAWQEIDWLAVIFYFLNALAEDQYEQQQGIIHSYRYKLTDWPDDMWDHAWVNRIALFLRRWVAVHFAGDEAQLLGELPTTDIIMTHDVDALSKTLAIRCKQSAFQLFNMLRLLKTGAIKKASSKFFAALRVFFSHSRYDYCDEMAQLEQQHGISSQFNLYGGKYQRRSFSQWLFDPAYKVKKTKWINLFRNIKSCGHQLGLHQSYYAWDNGGMMAREKTFIENALAIKINSCRQHWLRFSWQHTWREQTKAGLQYDTTLGFNDRPGFRNAAALAFKPWDRDADNAQAIEAWPLVMMDSHFYDYQLLDEQQRKQQLARWVNEIKAVRGQATVLWHPHTLSRDYGWRAGYLTLIDLLGDRR